MWFIREMVMSLITTFKIQFHKRHNDRWQPIMHARTLWHRRYLLTYLIGHNMPINGFWPDGTHPFRRLCILRTYASLSHQSRTGVPRYSPSNGYKVVLFVDFRRFLHQISVSREHLFSFSNQMVEPAQPVDINTLRNIYVVEELVHFSIISDAEIIALDWNLT